jgi:hypothetical protein
MVGRRNVRRLVTFSRGKVAPVATRLRPRPRIGIDLAVQADGAASKPPFPLLSFHAPVPVGIAGAARRNVAVGPMRWIAGIIVSLLAVGLLCCQLEGLSANWSASADPLAWVRTVDGWERSLNWSPSLAGPPAIHPAVLAAGQVLFSVFALAAFAGSMDREATGQ